MGCAAYFHTRRGETELAGLCVLLGILAIVVPIGIADVGRAGAARGMRRHAPCAGHTRRNGRWGMMRGMSRSVDVIVIGAGVQGASLAFHLARKGASVLVLERGTVAG